MIKRVTLRSPLNPSDIIPSGLDGKINCFGLRSIQPHRSANTPGDQKMSVNRREVCLLLPGLVALATQLPALAEDNSLPSGAFRFEQLPLHIANNNAQIRMIMRGKLATGEGIEVHQTTLPPGGAPTPTTHHHAHSEMWLVREGTIQLTVDGKNFRLDAGSVGFAHSNEEHGITNTGAGPATYFLVAIGPGAELQT